MEGPTESVVDGKQLGPHDVFRFLNGSVVEAFLAEAFAEVFDGAVDGAPFAGLGKSLKPRRPVLLALRLQLQWLIALFTINGEELCV